MIYIIRIIAGQARGLRISTLRGDSTRPTLDRVREAVFNIISPRINGCEFLDLFAGSGINAFEAVSRGAASAYAVDKDRRCYELIKLNKAKLVCGGKVTVMNIDYIRALNEFGNSQKKFDIIYVDPPFASNYYDKALELIYKLDILRQNGLVICEHDAGYIMPQSTEGLSNIDSRKYGNVRITFYTYKQ